MAKEQVEHRADMVFPEEDNDNKPAPVVPLAKLLVQPVSELGLSTRTVNNLDENGVHKVSDLLECCPEDPTVCVCARKHLLDFSNFGPKTLIEVYNALEAKGFKKQSQ